MKQAFVIPGSPIPWKAPFSGRRGTFSDPKMKAYKEHVSMSVWAQMAERKILGTWPTAAKRYVMTVRAYFKTKRFADITNIRKNVEDALQGILYENDRSVDHGPGERFHDPVNPRLELVIEVIEQ